MSRRNRGPAGPSNAFTTAGGGEGGGDDDAERYITKDGFNLRGWASKHAKRFEVQTMLEDVIGGDFIREPRQSRQAGTHVECPFEAEHTNLGGGGTYVVNASTTTTTASRAASLSTASTTRAPAATGSIFSRN
jgi:hypothetical protein